MALASQAALLDELMGINRNSNSRRDPNWDDDSVCKYYLAGFCPHELFVNTKMSLGVCPKLHDNNLLTKYKNSSSFMKAGFEKLLKKFLNGFVRDVQRKIEINKNRLENGFLSGTEIAIQKRISSKEAEINETVGQLEKLGNEGRIEECQNLHTELEEKQKELKYDKIELENHRKSSREKQEDVCHICGAYISKNDPRNSIENHISGRIHCGYVRINEVLQELEKVIEEDCGNHSDSHNSNNENKRKYEKDSNNLQREQQQHHSSRDRSRQRSRERRHHHQQQHRNKPTTHSRTSKKDQRHRRSRSKSADARQSFNRSCHSKEQWRLTESKNGTPSV